MRQSLTVIVLAGIAAIGLTSPTLRAGPLAQLHAGVIAGQRQMLERVVYRRCSWQGQAALPPHIAHAATILWKAETARIPGAKPPAKPWMGIVAVSKRPTR